MKWVVNNNCEKCKGEIHPSEEDVLILPKAEEFKCSEIAYMIAVYKCEHCSCLIELGRLMWNTKLERFFAKSSGEEIVSWVKYVLMAENYLVTPLEVLSSIPSNMVSCDHDIVFSTNSIAIYFDKDNREVPEFWYLCMLPGCIGMCEVTGFLDDATKHEFMMQYRVIREREIATEASSAPHLATVRQYWLRKKMGIFGKFEI